MMRQWTGKKGREKKKGEKLVLKMLMKCVILHTLIFYLFCIRKYRKKNLWVILLYIYEVFRERNIRKA